MDCAQLSQAFEMHLSLERPPVGVKLVSAPPDGVAVFEGSVPSACAFWGRAEAGVFYADAEKHFNCAVGALTHGFELPDHVQQQLGATVKQMFDCAYLAPEEPPHIPTMTRKAAGVLYGPLKDLPDEPDLVLMWLTPFQAMLWAEAAGACRWTGEARLPVLGRPACAALPLALNQGATALSLGCIGMRTFTGIGDDRLLAVVPFSRAPELAGALSSIDEANAAMRAAYQSHKGAFPT
jgi:uncharacterized protein (DUF169 family)